MTDKDRGRRRRIENLGTIPLKKIKLIEQIKWNAIKFNRYLYKCAYSVHAHTYRWNYFFSVFSSAAAVAAAGLSSFIVVVISLLQFISFFFWINVTKSDRQTDRGGKTNIQTLPINICVCVCVYAGYICVFFTNLWFGNIHFHSCVYVIMCMMISNGRSRFWLLFSSSL